MYMYINHLFIWKQVSQKKNVENLQIVKRIKPPEMVFRFKNNVGTEVKLFEIIM